MNHRLILRVMCACLLAAASGRAQTPIEVRFSSGSGAFGFILGGSAVPAIRGFNVGFTNGDHQVRDLHVAPSHLSDYLVLLRDSSGVDPISGFVKLADVRRLGYQWEISRADCVGTCRVNLPFVVPPQFTVVLTGFDFHYSTLDGGPDTNIREIRIDPAPQNAYILVRFGDTAGTRPYFARITFTIVSNSALAARDRLAQSSVPVRGAQTVSRPPGEALLQAFSLYFTESDHFLKRVAVDLTDDRVSVRFQDRDGNDPFVWWVKFALLP